MPLLGNLIYTGLATLLTTQTTVGAINSAPNLYSINSGQASTVTIHTAMLQPVLSSGQLLAIAAGIGPYIGTVAPVLVTRTSNVSVWGNFNTTAQPAEILAAHWHSRIT